MRREGVRHARTLGGGDRADDRVHSACPQRERGAPIRASRSRALQAIKRSLSPAERKLDSPARGRPARPQKVAARSRSTSRVRRPDADLVAAAAEARRERPLRLAAQRRGPGRGPGVGELAHDRGLGRRRARRPGRAGHDDAHRRQGDDQGGAGRRAPRPCGAPPRRSSPRAIAAHGADTVRARDHVTGIGVKVCALSRRRRLARRLAGRGRAARRRRRAAGPGGRRRRGHGDARDRPRHRAGRRARLRHRRSRATRRFADNIRALRFDAGCDVIVDDVLYYNESPFQDGPIAQSVNAVTADGALYFSSAGNEGNTLDGTSGNYEDDFRGSGRARRQVRRRGARLRSRPGGAGLRADLRRLERRRAGDAVLGRPARRAPPTTTTSTCSTPPAASSNFSQDVQDGDDDPYEILGTPTFGGTGLRLAVVRFSGAPRYFQLSALRRPLLRRRRGLPAWVDPGRDPRPLRGRAGVQHGRRPGRRPAAVRPRAGRPAEPDAARSRASSPRPSCRSASPPTGRGGCSSTPRRTRAATRAEAGHHGRRRRDRRRCRTSSRSSAPPPPRRTRRRSPRSCCSGNPAATIADVREAFDATALDLAPAGRRRPHRPRHPARRQRARATRARRRSRWCKRRTADGDDRRPATATPSSSRGRPATLRAAGDQRRRRHGDRHQRHGRHHAATPPATITPRTRAYGDLPPGATASRDFTLTLAAELPARQARAARGPGHVRRRALADRRRRSRSPTGQPATTAGEVRLHRPAGADPGREHARRVGDDRGHRRRLRVEASRSRSTARTCTTTTRRRRRWASTTPTSATSRAR